MPAVAVTPDTDTPWQSGLTGMSYVISDANRHEFVPGNPVTIGNFPGFQLGDLYRIYIQYFSQDGTMLNTGNEVSEDRQTPLVLASAPMVC